MANLLNLKKELKAHATPRRAEASAWFFKTDKAGYAAGDLFIGVTVPEQRKVAKKYANLPLAEVEGLLHSKVHEFRLTALIILVGQYKKADRSTQKKIYDLYLLNTKWINNWDLVDTSAGYIVGPWLEGRAEKMKVLTRLAKSKDLWERRIAMIATFAYIMRGNSDEAIYVATILLHDKHDLIQKAVGWMLREIGKRASREVFLYFLEQHAATMPRTTLRYAIEHFTPAKRKYFMNLKNA